MSVLNSTIGRSISSKPASREIAIQITSVLRGVAGGALGLALALGMAAALRVSGLGAETQMRVVGATVVASSWLVLALALYAGNARVALIHVAGAVTTFALAVLGSSGDGTLLGVALAVHGAAGLIQLLLPRWTGHAPALGDAGSLAWMAFFATLAALTLGASI